MSGLGGLQALWRRVLPKSAREFAGPGGKRGDPQPTPASAHAAARRAAPAGQGLKVVGLFSATSGIAASAKLCVRAFEALGVPVEKVDVGGERRPRFHPRPVPARPPRRPGSST